MGWFQRTVSKYSAILGSTYMKPEGISAVRGPRGRRSIAQRCRLPASDLALDGVPSKCSGGGFRKLEHSQAARLITYHNENGPPFEVEGARRLVIVDSERLPAQVYRVRRAPKGHLNRQSPQLAFLSLCVLRLPSPPPFLAFSQPLPLSTSCICPRSSLFPSSSMNHLRHTPQHLNPTEGAVGECLVLLIVGVVSLYMILAAGHRARLRREAVSALRKALAIGSRGAWTRGRY